MRGLVPGAIFALRNRNESINISQLNRLYPYYLVYVGMNCYLESRGATIGTGTIVDATLLEAPSSTRKKSGRRDPEMRLAALVAASRLR